MYSSTELARRLGVSPTTINARIRCRDIKPTIINPAGYFKFSEQDLNTLVDKWSLKETEYTTEDVIQKYGISKSYAYTTLKKSVSYRYLVNGRLVFDKVEVDEYFETLK